LRLTELGLTLQDLALRQLVQLTGQLIGLPRHLSQHPGAFVLTQGPLSRLVPIENAAMPQRSVILRPKLAQQAWNTAAELHDLPSGRLARACGIVTVRQQPETAKGVMSVSLEDETGSVQVIVWPKVKLKFRVPLLRSRLIAVKGTWQRKGEVRNLIAEQVEDLTAMPGGLVTASRDFQ